MAKIGRNDPCPCGSGKKYKRCCLARVETRSGFTQGERLSALDKLERFVLDELEPEEDIAFDVFYEEWDDRMEELDRTWLMHSEAVYDLWFYLDYPLPGGKRVADLFLEGKPLLTAGERSYLEHLRETAMRLYEVKDLTPGVSVTLRDILDDTTLTIHERQGSRSMLKYSVIAARIIACGASGHPEMEMGVLHIPKLVQDGLISQLSSHRQSYRRDHPQAGDIDFFKEMVPFFHDAWISCLLDPPIPHMVNTDGEDMIQTSILFEVSRPARLEAVLDGAKDLERTGDGKAVWTWSGKNREGEPVILGHLVLKGQSLKLECNSVQRGKRGRAMIEALAGGTLRHRSTAHENIEKKLRESIRQGRSADRGETANELPREIEEALVQDNQSRYYRKWLDDKIPALDDNTPRQASLNAGLRPKLFDLLHGLESMYQRALMDGRPAFDPSWMWSELGIEERARPGYPPPLSHERMATMLPGLGELCCATADQLRRQPGFDDKSTVVTAREIGANLEIQRFLRRNQPMGAGSRPPASRPHEQPSDPTTDLAPHIEYMINFELHRRKTFWVDESLAYLLAKTDLDVPGQDLRLPFPSFALVFIDRYMLSLAERMLSLVPGCPLAGHFLRVATVYVREEDRASERVLHVCFALDALGADLPYLVEHEIVLRDDVPVRLISVDPPPIVVEGINVPVEMPLQGLLRVTLNAVLYATSADVTPQVRSSPSRARSGEAGSEPEVVEFSKEDVFFLPGAIEISLLRNYQQLERISDGRKILHRFMVRGHWRRAAPGWKDQRMRWIAPYWKGPDLAAIIERTYKLKP